jgi:hypothetical protein
MIYAGLRTGAGMGEYAGLGHGVWAVELEAGGVGKEPGTGRASTTSLITGVACGSTLQFTPAAPITMRASSRETPASPPA